LFSYKLKTKKLGVDLLSMHNYSTQIPCQHIATHNMIVEASGSIWFPQVYKDYSQHLL
jgi:hypothetical protein